MADKTIQNMFHTQFVAVFIISLLSKFDTPGSYILLVFIKPKLKYRICMAAMLLFYITHKITLTKLHIFLVSITKQNFRELY
jgi:hypothetical protein